MKKSKNADLITPYGDDLINLIEPEETQDELRIYASTLPSIQIALWAKRAIAVY